MKVVLGGATLSHRLAVNQLADHGRSILQIVWRSLREHHRLLVNRKATFTSDLSCGIIGTTSLGQRHLLWLDDHSRSRAMSYVMNFSLRWLGLTLLRGGSLLYRMKN